MQMLAWATQSGMQKTLVTALVASATPVAPGGHASAEHPLVCYSACEIWCQHDPVKIRRDMGEDQGKDRQDATRDDRGSSWRHPHIGTWARPKATTETMLANRYEPARSDRRVIA